MMAGKSPDSCKQAGYGTTVKHLKDLMETRGTEAYDKLNIEIGGVTELCRKLKTSPVTGYY